MPPIVAPWLHRLLLAALLCSLLPFTAHADEEEDFPARLRACAACHGERGRSAEEAYYPSIAGKPAGYLYAQLRNFREGRRQHECEHCDGADHVRLSACGLVSLMR